MHEPPMTYNQGELKCSTVYACLSQAAHQIAHQIAHQVPPREYNFCVARGWESKSVELQQDDARSSIGSDKPRLTPEQREVESRKRGLELSRSRILEQLRSSENPRYREVLQQSLAMLDQQISELGRS
jgi:hypothetical protein